MITLQDLSEAFERNISIVLQQTNGLTNEESFLHLPEGSNCLNWVLGHIANNRDIVLKVLGEDLEIGEASARYKRESEPVVGPGEGVVSLEELQSWLKRLQKRTTEALSKADLTVLTQVNEGSRKSRAQYLITLFFHETYHVGQAEIFRQLAGKNDKII